MIVDQVVKNAVQGPQCVVDGWILTCTFTQDEMDAILAGYDQATQTSPSAGICRPIIRQMLDAVIAYTPDGG